MSADGERKMGTAGSGAAKSQKAAEPPPVKEAAKILIVEDEPNMVAGLRDNFEYEGYRVIAAVK